jgi:hypothetical protein
MELNLSTLLMIAVVGFIQNMAFTWSSRSRNSGDPKYHFFVAIGSNGIWFAMNFFLILPEMLKVVESGDVWDKILVMGTYVLFTSLGSAFMMMWAKRFEKGKRKVGS